MTWLKQQQQFCCNLSTAAPSLKTSANPTEHTWGLTWVLLMALPKINFQ